MAPQKAEPLERANGLLANCVIALRAFYNRGVDFKAKWAIDLHWGSFEDKMTPAEGWLGLLEV